MTENQFVSLRNFLEKICGKVLTFSVVYGILCLSDGDGQNPPPTGADSVGKPHNPRAKVEPPRTRTAGGGWQPAFLTPRAVAKRAIPDRTRTLTVKVIKRRSVFRYRKPRAVRRISEVRRIPSNFTENFCKK